MSLAGTTLVPDFDADTTRYSLFVPYEVDDAGNNGDDEIAVAATASDNQAQTILVGATVAIMSDKDDSNWQRW